MHYVYANVTLALVTSIHSKLCGYSRVTEVETAGYIICHRVGWAMDVIMVRDITVQALMDG